MGVAAMTRALALLALLVASSSSAQWSGTITGKPVTCTPAPVPAALFVSPTGGDAATVTAVALRCRGAKPYRFVDAQIYVLPDHKGTLALDGELCKIPPRHRKGPVPSPRKCCTLVPGTFAGDFRPAYPPAEITGPIIFQTGTLTGFTTGASCKRKSWPVGAVDVHDDTAPAGSGPHGGGKATGI